MTSTTPHAQASAESNSQDTFQMNTDAMPEQRHAGKVGYGPNYHAGPTLEDKVAGLKEELIGKVTRNPERFHHGHEMLTGEERRKKLTGADEPNPFQVGEDDKSNKEEPSQRSPGSQSRISDTVGTPPGGGVGTGTETPQSTPAG